MLGILHRIILSQILSYEKLIYLYSNPEDLIRFGVKLWTVFRQFYAKANII